MGRREEEIKIFADFADFLFWNILPTEKISRGFLSISQGSLTLFQTLAESNSCLFQHKIRLLFMYLKTFRLLSVWKWMPCHSHISIFFRCFRLHIVFVVVTDVVTIAVVVVFFLCVVCTNPIIYSTTNSVSWIVSFVFVLEMFSERSLLFSRLLSSRRYVAKRKSIPTTIGGYDRWKRRQQQRR